MKKRPPLTAQSAAGGGFFILFRVNLHGLPRGEEIKDAFPDRKPINERKRPRIGLQLRRVARGLRVEVAADAVGLEVEDDQPLRFVPKAVHHALQQHLFPGCRRIICRRVGQNGEFELAAQVLRVQNPLSKLRGKQRQNFLRVYRLGLPGRQKFFRLQPRKLLLDAIARRAGLVVDELHEKVRRVSFLAACQRPVLQKLRRAPWLSGRLRLCGRFLRRFQIKSAPLQLRGRQLGRQPCRRLVRVPEAHAFQNLNSEEDYLDLGAYRGDTIDEFLKYTCNHYHSITALEPEPKTFKKLVEARGDLENTTLLNKAVWSFDTELEFRADMGRGSLIKNNGGLLAETVSIDSLAEDTKFTYIKMDVEGVEFVVLSGGMTLMAEHKPKLNIACYHRCCDIYRLPAVIHRANPNYKIYMRHHPYIPCWDTNLYCI